MLNGNMLVGVRKSSLIVRLGSDHADTALKEPQVREFDVAGRPMKGWVMVKLDGLENDRQLAGIQETGPLLFRSAFVRLGGVSFP